MGLLRRHSKRAEKSGRARSSNQHSGPNSRSRRCRFEQMEPRRLLAADFLPIQIGAVYFEDGSGEDEVGDVVEITFVGGAEGTQLTELRIDTDKYGDGLSIGDVFFDIAAGGEGAFESNPLVVLDSSGIDSYSYEVVDGGTELVFRFTGFDAGEKFAFSIDVDERGALSANAVAEGNEFEASVLSATFAAPHFYTTTGADLFLDYYDNRLEDSGLDLPNDDYQPPSSYMPPTAEPGPVYTAAAIFSVEQTPLPITIAGTVYEDIDVDNTQDTGEPGIENVELTLLRMENGTYVATGITATTDADGHYLFEGVLPGTYQIAETQPDGYYSVGARAGTVDGSIRGVVRNADTLSAIELDGGEDSIGNDFGEALPASVSGYVYHDADDDGTMDSTESGIAGVTLELLDADGKPTGTTAVTDANGYYQFDNLPPGVYGIREVQPDGYFDGTDVAGTAGGSAQNPGDQIDDLRLISRQTGQRYNFGELMPASISGRVHADTNGNCLYDPGEQFLADVTIELLDELGQVVATTTTDANGEYVFTGLHPGVYSVHEIQPDGYFDGGDRVGSEGGTLVDPDSITAISLGSGVVAVSYDFCEKPPSTISGRVYADANRNEQLDSGEQRLAGVTVRLLDASGATLATTTTDANGEYCFDGLAPGTYGVYEEQPDGYYDGAESVGSEGGTLAPPDSITQITLLGGTDAIDYDFGELLPSSISGHVYADSNSNAWLDDGEELLAGVTVHLLDASGNVLATTTTDSNGEYLFDGLAPGTYGVEEEQPEGYFDGAEHVGSAGGSRLAPDSIIDIELLGGTQSINNDFGELPPSSISGTVYADINGNGRLDDDEWPIEGVTLQLLGAAGNVIETTQTNAAGYYEFTGLATGLYSVSETQPEYYYDGADYAGSLGGTLSAPDSIIDVVLPVGTDAIEYDFTETPPAGISGFVYVDDNDNGQFDSGETPLQGVTVELLDAAGNSTGQTATTSAGGYYRFDVLEPGTYGVREVQPEGYYDGQDTPGDAGGTAVGNDQITGAVLGSAVLGRYYNFGELRPASIQGQVHAELNGDCIVDPDETLLEGVTVYLLDADGNRIAETTTDAEGRYVFDNLAPGTYGVEEIQPADYLQGKTHAGSAGGVVVGDRISEVELGSGEDATEYNFCEMTPAKISGYVFQDGDTIKVSAGETLPDPATVRNGQFTADDTPIAGVVLTLGDGSGAPLQDSQGNPITAVTDANGYYEFTMLEPGLYTVLEEHPSEYVDGVDTPGTTGGIAINPSDNLDPMMLGMLAVDPKDDAIVRIPLAMGEHASSNNFSEVVYQEDTPKIIPPPTPPNRDPDPVTPPPVYSAPPQSISRPLVIYNKIEPLLGGSSGPGGQTWHLSVINAGMPRRSQQGTDSLTNPTNRYFDPITWTGVAVDQGHWTLTGPDGTVSRQFDFGIPGAIPITGDFNGDGVDEAGVFIDGAWFIDLNGNGIWDSEDFFAQLGGPGDQPVVGDWDGDGKADIGIFGPSWIGDPKAIAAEPGLPDAGNHSTGAAKNLPPDPANAAIGYRSMQRGSQNDLRSDLIDHVFKFGTAGDKAVAGDFDGDGVASIGVFREGHWYLDVDGNGRWSDADVKVAYGQRGDTPVVGDFNNDGIDEIGVYRAGTWYLDTNGDYRLDAHDKVFEQGGSQDKPAVGDFDGDGIDEIILYRDDAA